MDQLARLPELGFFEALSQTLPETPDWNALCAGLAIVRYACDLLIPGLTPRHALVDRAKEYLDHFVDEPVRGVLLSTLRAAAPTDHRVDEADPERRRLIASRLMVYAKALHDSARWAPAADTYGVVARYAKQSGDVHLALRALWCRAFATRLLRRFDQAATMYSELHRLAESIGSESYQLDAELGYAKLAIDRGNIPAAQQMVEAVIARASASSNPEEVRLVLGRAMIDRSCVAGIRCDHAGVVEWCYRALEHTSDRVDRERLFVNIAIAFRESGRGLTATKLAGRVAEEALAAEHRGTARVLLMHTAIDVADAEAFEYHRSKLASAELTPVLQAEFLEASARGLAAAGDQSAAIVALERMVKICEQHKLAELTIRADKSLADVWAGRVPKVYWFSPPTTGHAGAVSTLDRIGSAIDTLPVAPAWSVGP